MPEACSPVGVLTIPVFSSAVMIRRSRNRQDHNELMYLAQNLPWTAMTERPSHVSEDPLAHRGVYAVDQQETQIRREIEYTRAAMSAKVAMIQERIEGTVDETGSTVIRAMNTVLERVQQVQDMIQNVTSTVDTTVERIQDVTHKAIAEGKPGIELIADMHRRPWVMLGAAVVVGYILGSGGRPSSEVRPAIAGSASGAKLDGFTRDKPTGSPFIPPAGSSVGSKSTPSPARITDPAGPS
jgi:hypothetical protein